MNRRNKKILRSGLKMTNDYKRLPYYCYNCQKNFKTAQEVINHQELCLTKLKEKKQQ